MDVDKHAEELASALGVDKSEVRSDLENLLQYSVPIEEAKQSIRRKHGDGGGGSAEPVSLDVAEVTADRSNVTVTGKVLTVGRRTIRYQGEDVEIREGELADETGVISYTAWQDFGFEPGDSITVGNAGVREWDGQPELNLGENTSVAVADDVNVPYEVGGESSLIDLEPGDRGRTVEVRVLEMERRTIDGRDGETEILSGEVGDETGRLPFTDWSPRAEVEPGADLRIEDVYVREFRGVPSVNLSEYTTVTPLPEPVAVREDAPRLSVGDAVETGGMYDVEVVGTAIQVRDGSGLIERCPECGRVVQGGQCRSHGAVDAEDDLRIKAIVDDGTGTLTAILGTELTAEVYGGGIEEAKSAARDAMDKEVVAAEIASRIEGRTFRVRGNLSVDDYGANLDADAFEQVEVDPAEEARAALERLGSAPADGPAADGGERR
ncbi:ssDNA-binding replication factor A, large subunit [Halalkaliarchaeum sp. AArc-CO]|uniref:Single-stranded DNA binding protein n=1 Tax=Halalkaliarchaeum sp. AArc-CO TaxID=2866381 RepID=UPI00217D3644|nr:Single-stranded DNA binding protein [Halalkaliarchaeum sp. AArc-CO]UWG51204.1 ssDNA-binding replication factor A, large subunit [Halalkaliarchaeum sp. AArc-CO]